MRLRHRGDLLLSVAIRSQFVLGFGNLLPEAPSLPDARAPKPDGKHRARRPPVRRLGAHQSGIADVVHHLYNRSHSGNYADDEARAHDKVRDSGRGVRDT